MEEINKRKEILLLINNKYNNIIICKEKVTIIKTKNYKKKDVIYVKKHECEKLY